MGCARLLLLNLNSFSGIIRLCQKECNENVGCFQKNLRQDIDGLQAEQLESVHCGQILQDKDDSRSERRVVPDERETMYFSFLRSKRPS